MRGLPWCGKSYRANELKGSAGAVFGSDDYFYQVVNPENPKEYSFKTELLPNAHSWNLQRVQESLWAQYLIGFPNPIIVDNTNVKLEYAINYIYLANFLQIQVKIEEPTSPRWKEIRKLLENKEENKEKLQEWAVKLAEGSVGNHNVPVEVIQTMIENWENDFSTRLPKKSALQ